MLQKKVANYRITA